MNIIVKSHKRKGRVVRSHMRKTQKGIAQKLLKKVDKPTIAALREVVKKSDEVYTDRKRASHPMPGFARLISGNFEGSHSKKGVKLKKNVNTYRGRGSSR